MPAVFSRRGWSKSLRQSAFTYHHLHPAPRMLGYYSGQHPTALPALPALPSPGWWKRRREPGPHTHLLDALQSVIGLLDVPVHRIHSGRFAGFYPRAMNVVQPVKTGESGCHWGCARPANLIATFLPLHKPAHPSGLCPGQPCAGGRNCTLGRGQEVLRVSSVGGSCEHWAGMSTTHFHTDACPGWCGGDGRPIFGIPGSGLSTLDVAVCVCMCVCTCVWGSFHVMHMWCMHSNPLTGATPPLRIPHALEFLALYTQFHFSPLPSWERRRAAISSTLFPR